MEIPAALWMTIDVGTLSTRVSLIGTGTQVVYARQEPLALHHLDDWRTEQDAEQIAATTCRLVKEASAWAAGQRMAISAAGLATQRSSVLGWQRKPPHRAISPLLSWQDRRTQQWLRQQAWDADELFRETGLPMSPHYGAAKIRWLLDHCPDCGDEARSLCGPLAAFLIQRLTSTAPSVDITNAARMQLIDLAAPHDWSERRLRQFGIPRSLLPEVRPARDDFGLLSTGPSGPPISLRWVCGDQAAAFYAEALADDEALLNLGTGGFLLQPAPGNPPERLLRSPGPCGEMFVEGTINGVGAALEWARQTLGINESLHQLPWSQWRRSITRWSFHNRIGGVGSPWWLPEGESFWNDPEGRRRAPSDPRDAMLAVLDSIARLVADNVDAMRMSTSIECLVVTGGVARIQPLLDRIGHACRCRIRKSAVSEATSVGLARLLARDGHDGAGDRP